MDGALKSAPCACACFFFVGVATSCYVSYTVNGSRVGLFIFFVCRFGHLPIWPFRQWTTNSRPNKIQQSHPHHLLSIVFSETTIKPWPNGLASQRKTSVRLAFRWTSHLRCLACTCVDFGRAQIRTQVDASFSPFGHPTQVDPSWSQVNCIWLKFTTFCNLWTWAWTWTCEPPCESVWPPIVSPYASSGFVNLRRLASPFGKSTS